MTTTPRRPDPDELLARVRAEEAEARRGKLTLFFGAAPARARPGEVEVEVADRGPGVAPADASHVFEKFFRAGKAGVGLGLTICRGIVAAHGGRIWVVTREGGGASFRFTLPVKEGSPTEGKDLPALASPLPPATGGS